jgi:alpha-D-ribose 1-methylphosphonate 5-triphosphate synthase subunit PhnI
MKTLKPAGNVEYNENNKVFIVKFAEDIDIDGRVKTLKYPVPFYANNNEELQVILKLYLEQGLENMRITTVSETQWKILK